jgi:hypothetical protein
VGGYFGTNATYTGPLPGTGISYGTNNFSGGSNSFQGLNLDNYFAIMQTNGSPTIITNIIFVRYEDAKVIGRFDCEQGVLYYTNDWDLSYVNTTTTTLI